MVDQAGANSKTFDQMKPLQDLRDTYLEAWGKAMVQVVNTEAYAQANGALVDSYLTFWAPFAEIIERATSKTVSQLGMPSRADVLSIAERLTNIEMRLDDLEAKLDQANAMHRETGELRNGGRKRGQRASASAARRRNG